MPQTLRLYILSRIDKPRAEKPANRSSSSNDQNFGQCFILLHWWKNALHAGAIVFVRLAAFGLARQGIP